MVRDSYYPFADTTWPSGTAAEGAGAWSGLLIAAWTEDRNEGNDAYANSLISASACSSQNGISISRYIVVAAVRCSCACSRLPVRQ